MCYKDNLISLQDELVWIAEYWDTWEGTWPSQTRSKQEWNNKEKKPEKMFSTQGK